MQFAEYVVNKFILNYLIIKNPAWLFREHLFPFYCVPNVYLIKLIFEPKWGKMEIYLKMYNFACEISRVPK